MTAPKNTSASKEKPSKKIEAVAPIKEVKPKEEPEIIKIDAQGKIIEDKKAASKDSETKFNLKNLKSWQKALGICVVILIFSGLIYGLFRAFGLGKWQKDVPDDQNPSASQSSQNQVEPKDHESPLTGNLITKTEYDKIVARRPMGVMIENHVDARPQSGLNDADLVYEALAEGGISRFMAIYLENEPDKVGPVRSLRKYYLDWISEMRDGLIMHIGYAQTDNPDTNALGYVYKYNVKALGIFLSNTFWRVSQKVAPHNAYASVKDLWSKAKDKGWTGVVDLDKWQFKDDAASTDRGTTTEISFDWQGWGQTDYSVEWKYDTAQNVYLRSQNTIAHTDAETGDQIFAKNVVLEIIPSHFTVDTDGKSRVIYDLVGTGDAVVFMDGKAIKAKWQKSDRVARTKFFDENGVEIKFNRGRTWISALPLGSDYKY